MTACSGADASRSADRDRAGTAPGASATAAPHSAPDGTGPHRKFSDWDVGATPLPLRTDGFGRVLPTPRERMGTSWRPSCPVGLRDLRYVRVSFWGFDDRAHTGEVIVHRRAAHDVEHVFARLYRAKFPIEGMRIATSLDLDARPTGDGNVSGGFVCRPIRNGSSWSAHSYGLAIDINPFQNPYQRDDLVLPERASSYLNRDRVRPGMLRPNDVVVRAFEDIGWSWGGKWHSPLDYMHFSATNG